MRKILISAVAGAALAVVPAMASKPATTPTHPDHPAKAKGRCKLHHVVGFNAKGTLKAGGYALTQDAGQTTYSGTLEVIVTKANHHAGTGDVTYNVSHAKVSFYSVNGTPVTTPATGDIVHIHGTIGHAPKKCGSTWVPTVTRVSFTQAPPAPEAPAAPTS